jgi:hypothetical protein
LALSISNSGNIELRSNPLREARAQANASLSVLHRSVEKKRDLAPRSMPGDLDLTVYSLRKWCRLALKGNPSVQLLLYTPEVLTQTALGKELRSLAPAFASKRVGKAYLGYMNEQRARLVGERGQKDVKREELVKKYGFDTKYAYHMLRLGFQGIEFMCTGELELPITEREYLKDVRTGVYTLDNVKLVAEGLTADLELAIMESQLPDEPNTAHVNEWLFIAYQYHWRGQGLTPAIL